VIQNRILKNQMCIIYSSGWNQRLSSDYGMECSKM